MTSQLSSSSTASFQKNFDFLELPKIFALRKKQTFIRNQHLPERKSFIVFLRSPFRSPLICLPSIYSGPHWLHLHSGFIVILSMAETCSDEKHFLLTMPRKQIFGFIIIHSFFIAINLSERKTFFGKISLMLDYSSTLLARTYLDFCILDLIL